jgi:hypothetical protein
VLQPVPALSPASLAVLALAIAAMAIGMRRRIARR